MSARHRQAEVDLPGGRVLVAWLPAEGLRAGSAVAGGVARVVYRTTLVRGRCGRLHGADVLRCDDCGGRP